MNEHETEIVADDKVPTIEIIRQFDASPEQVFRAHVDPDLYRQWVGPRSVTTRIIAWNARTGGAWSFANDRDGEEIASFFGSFHEVRANERIVWTFTYEGDPDSVALETMAFEARDDGGTRLRVLSVLSDFATRDGMLSSGMDVGVREGYEKLDALLTGSAAQHARDAAAFTALVESVSGDAWSRPSPVPEWNALGVVEHLVGWSRGFLGGVEGVELTELDVARDPAAAWARHVADIQAILDAPAGRILSNPHIGDMPVEDAIDRFYTADVWMHTWDLAKALGREPDLGEERCAAALIAMKPMDRMLRESGQYGPAVDVDDNASAQDRLMAFIGRDPSWSPDN
jgi:uncharacterized protein (TIGR03086 family)